MQDDLQKMIAQDLGIADLAVEEQNQLITEFGEIALKAATIAVLEKLAPEKRDEFAKIAEGDDAAAMQAFLNANVPDHEQIAKAAVEEEVRQFKEFQTTAKQS
jgi:hypothetical protein